MHIYIYIYIGNIKSFCKLKLFDQGVTNYFRHQGTLKRCYYLWNSINVHGNELESYGDISMDKYLTSP
jgi:hypothetical protein